MMTIDLKSYLKNWRTDLVAAAERKRVEAMDRALDAETIEADIADLERAIAALEPAPEPSRAELEAETYGARIHHNDIASIGYADAVGYPPDQPETPIPEGFVAWGGGERPVDAAQLVEIMYANGMRSYGVAENAWWQWQRPGDYRGIIAYRLLPPTETADETPEQTSAAAEGRRPEETSVAVDVSVGGGAESADLVDTSSTGVDNMSTCVDDLSTSSKSTTETESSEAESVDEQPQGPSPVEDEWDGWKPYPEGRDLPFERNGCWLEERFDHKAYRWMYRYRPADASTADPAKPAPVSSDDASPVELQGEQPKSPEPVGEDA